MRSFMLMLVSLVLVAAVSIPAIIMQSMRYIIMRKPLSELFMTVAIGFDQAGGSILYGEEDWTISSRTYYLRERGNKYAAIFEKIINLFFGKDHCENSYNSEFQK